MHAEVVDLEDRLKDRYPRFKYFPFQDYRPTEIRARQAYLTKMPVELLHLSADLGDSASRSSTRRTGHSRR